MISDWSATFLRQFNEGEQMPRMIQLMVETDDVLESSWRTRQWVTFIRVWLVTSVAMVAVAFVIPFTFISTAGHFHC